MGWTHWSGLAECSQVQFFGLLDHFTDYLHLWLFRAHWLCVMPLNRAFKIEIFRVWKVRYLKISVQLLWLLSDL